MTEAEFIERLSFIRDDCDRLLADSLTDDQLIGLGAALQERAQVIIERFQFKGYRRRE